MSLLRLSTPVAALAAVGLLHSEAHAAPLRPDVTITPAGLIEVCDGEGIMLTGIAWHPDTEEPVTCGRIHLQLWDGEEFVDLVKGPSDGDGVSLIFDTTGLAGTELFFLAHFEPGGPRGVGCPGGDFKAGESDILSVLVIECAEEGCGQGFWKNHPDEWADTGFAPADTIGDAFAGADFGGLDPGTTLMEALGFKGGPGNDGMRRILLRQAVAAMLNAAHPGVDYPLNDDEVYLDVFDALNSNDAALMEFVKNELEALNELGCPLG